MRLCRGGNSVDAAFRSSSRICSGLRLRTVRCVAIRLEGLEQTCEPIELEALRGIEEGRVARRRETRSQANDNVAAVVLFPAVRRAFGGSSRLRVRTDWTGVAFIEDLLRGPNEQ